MISGRELMRWQAWEHVYGPVLAQDRIDVGLATVAFTVAQASGAKRRGGGRLRFSDFLPPWLKGDAQVAAGDESVRRGLEQLRLMALAQEQHVEGWERRPRAND